MKVLVTGATGFIGQKLCHTLLERGHELMCINRSGRYGDENYQSPITFIPYSMGDPLPISVIDFSPQVLVHLAWDGIPDFSEKKSVENLKSQLRFLKETERLVRLKTIVAAGTSREYGAKQGACLENESVPPNSYFSRAKQSLRDYFTLNCKARGINLLWLRIFYVYGPGQRSESLIPTLIKAFKMKKNPEIKNPLAVNDYIYIDDVVSAFVTSIESDDCQGTFNLGSGHTTAVAEIVKHVEYVILSSDSFSSQLIKKTSEHKNSSGMWADMNSSKKTLGWIPSVSLADGIARTCRLGNYE